MVADAETRDRAASVWRRTGSEASVEPIWHGARCSFVMVFCARARSSDSLPLLVPRFSEVLSSPALRDGYVRYMTVTSSLLSLVGAGEAR